MTITSVARNRVALPIAIGCAIALIVPAGASRTRGSARRCPSPKLQLYSLAVPTEKAA